MRSKILSIFLLGMLALIFSCGKKMESTSPAIETSNRPLDSDLQKFLDKQQLVCENGLVCPNYLAKIVVVDGGQYRYCTGSLVKSDVVLTSSSCLTNLLRLNNLDCSRDIYFFFGKTFNRPPMRVGCKKVIQASAISGKEPILWRDDVAYLQLDQSVDYKRTLGISKDGIQAGRSLTLWGIEQVDESTAFIRRRNCEGVFNSYINPLATSDSSPNIPVAGCAFKNGFTGGVLIDGRGNLRATVSQGLDKNLKSYLESTQLLSKPLLDFIHTTNFACAPSIFDADILDGNECVKDLSQQMVDSIRTDMFSVTNLFDDMKAKLQASIDDINKYVAYEVSLTGTGDQRVASIYPKCFKKISSWIGSMGTANNYYYNLYLPQRTFKRSMDSYARIVSQEIKSNDKLFYFQFSLKFLRNTNSANVYMWDDSSNPAANFENLTDCPQTLLL